MPYGYISTEIDGEEVGPFQALMDTGSSLILVAMDFAEELLGRSSDDIIANRDHTMPYTGSTGATKDSYGWKIDLLLKANQADAVAMPIPGAFIYAVEAANIVGYPALFGQKTGFAQRWFKQHNHTAKLYWQLREWK